MKNKRYYVQDPWYNMFNDITMHNYLPHNLKYRPIYNLTVRGDYYYKFKNTINENIPICN